jgi:hypothetical protein
MQSAVRTRPHVPHAAATSIADLSPFPRAGRAYDAEVAHAEARRLDSSEELSDSVEKRRMRISWDESLKGVQPTRKSFSSPEAAGPAPAEEEQSPWAAFTAIFSTGS